MTDNNLPGPMNMVKIDGSKIKRLREEQGLTQLYLATAVHVTTDTISRWENRRYPSIKKENGIKLAEALNVHLDELLEHAESTPGEEVQAAIALPPSPRTSGGLKTGWRKVWPLFVLIVTLLSGLFSFLWFSPFSAPEITIAAERTVPGHCVAGQPFPVLIRVTGVPEEKSTALIVREQLPANATILKVSPELSGGGLKNDMIKWLKKINDTAVFAYVIKVSGAEGEAINFYGTAAISGDSGPPPPISGDGMTTIGHFHWADTDNDNHISDSEILAVHDQYGEIEGIDLDIDLIENMWLGTGYKWNEVTAVFEILE
jgi:transcriptional regulator with XRE-family HTH domain